MTETKMGSGRLKKLATLITGNSLSYFPFKAIARIDAMAFLFSISAGKKSECITISLRFKESRFAELNYLISSKGLTYWTDRSTIKTVDLKANPKEAHYDHYI